MIFGVTSGSLIRATSIFLAALTTFMPERAIAQAPAATFKSNVELVRLSAVVRDKKGRFVQNLSTQDFEVLDGREVRPISDFRSDAGGVSIALLFDVSGSMAGLLVNAREAAMHVLSWLDPTRDEAAIFTFDRELDEVAPFTNVFAPLLDRISAIEPYGGTSLHDAIAQTAQQVVKREGRRHAVVVFSDGNDNASRLTPDEV
jgi:VWFA-related protein